MSLPSLADLPHACDRAIDAGRIAAHALGPRLAAGADALDREGAFPHGNFPLLHEAGLIAYAAPAPHGKGAGLSACRNVIQAVAHAEPATALVLVMTYLQHRQLSCPGSRWPRGVQDRVLVSAAREGALINALRVEPELGTPARGGLPATVARRDRQGWRLSGHKLYATGIPALRWLAVWARTDEAQPRTGVFLVERRAGQAGLRVVESWNHLGLRASGSHEVIFDDVSLPFEHAVDLRAPEDWTPQRASTADREGHAIQQAWMSVLLGTLYDAVARAGRDWLLGFLAGRSPANLGRPLSTLPRVQEQVGEIEALLAANAAMLDLAALRVDAGEPPSPADSGLLKFNVTSRAIEAVERALRLSGNPGLSRGNPLERHYRDVLCGRVHTPQDDTILAAAGQAAFVAHQAARPGA